MEGSRWSPLARCKCFSSGTLRTDRTSRVRCLRSRELAGLSQPMETRLEGRRLSYLRENTLFQFSIQGAMRTMILRGL